MAWGFNGTTSKYERAVNPLPAAAPFAILCWVYLDADTNHAVIFNTHMGVGGADPGAILKWRNYGASGLCMSFFLTGMSAEAYHTGNPGIGVWIPVVAICHALDDVELYVNGTKTNDGTGTASAPNIWTNSSIGYYGAGNSNFFPGDVAEFAVVNVAPTTQQIADHAARFGIRRLFGDEEIIWHRTMIDDEDDDPLKIGADGTSTAITYVDHVTPYIKYYNPPTQASDLAPAGYPNPPAAMTYRLMVNPYLVDGWFFNLHTVTELSDLAAAHAQLGLCTDGSLQDFSISSVEDYLTERGITRYSTTFVQFDMEADLEALLDSGSGGYAAAVADRIVKADAIMAHYPLLRAGWYHLPFTDFAPAAFLQGSFDAENASLDSVIARFPVIYPRFYYGTLTDGEYAAWTEIMLEASLDRYPDKIIVAFSWPRFDGVVEGGRFVDHGTEWGPLLDGVAAATTSTGTYFCFKIWNPAGTQFDPDLPTTNQAGEARASLNLAANKLYGFDLGVSVAPAGAMFLGVG